MFSAWQILCISLAYLLLLFWIAWRGNQRAKQRTHIKPRPWIYSLTLTVYCTSWTFYGAVGQASTDGWLYLSIFLGPILTYWLAWPLLSKVFRISKAQNITSIADFIASRYGKWQVLAVVVTCFALIGTLPYIALQLKAIVMAYDLLIQFPRTATAISAEPGLLTDTAFYTALVLAVFTLFFGSRHIDVTEHHEGLIHAIAFESLVKLCAFVCIGLFALWIIHQGGLPSSGSEYVQSLQTRLAQTDFTQGFIAQTLLAMMAILLLPRMFHVTVVERAHPEDARYSRWFLPLYLLLFAAFTLPIAAAGLYSFTDGAVESDTYVLTLPLLHTSPTLTLLAFIGGFSAATSMAIMSTIAVSIMVSNEIVIPTLLKSKWLAQHTSHASFGRLVLRIRRLTMLFVLLMGYLTYRMLAEYHSLAATGFLAFAAIGQLAPAVFGGILWKRGNRWGALAGLLVGGLLWFYTLLLPSLHAAGMLTGTSLMTQGPLGISWLRPDNLLELTGMDYFSRGVFLSLGANLLTYLLVSRLTRQRVIDRIQASAFVDSLDHNQIKSSRVWQGTTRLGDLRQLAIRFVGETAVERAYRVYARQQHIGNLQDDDPASIELIQLTERLLAGVLGASSARIVISSALQGKEIKISDVVSIVDEASQVLEFNRSLLQATIENLSQGISVIDKHLNLVVWNQRYIELFNFPTNFIRVGRQAQDIFRYNARRGEYGPGDPETHVAQMLENIRLGEAHRQLRYRSDGTVLEIQGNPMPNGGFVYSYQDVTQQKQIEEALIQSENNIRIYTDNVPAMIAYFDREQRYLFTNRAYEETMGIDRNLVINRRIQDVLSRSEYEARKTHMQAALAGRRQTFELELPGCNKAFRYALVTYTPHFDEQGEQLGFFALYQDITERRLVEIALQETNEHLEERVRERTLALSELNAALLKENRIRAQAEQDMRLAKQQAEKANASKTRFLAAASHDLLQPLNAARLFTSALAQEVTDPHLKETTAHIDGSLHAAEELLSTLLDISKLDAGALQPKINDFPLKDILSPLKAEFSVMAAERQLSFDLVDTRAWVRSDPQMLRRILQNFLSNALRYTAQGRVVLGCRRKGAQLQLEVWDTGPGIPTERINEIFQEFHRLNTPDRHKEKGLGLGLSIAERMARVLEHDIQVRSWPGAGTCFSVRVPLAKAQSITETASSKHRLNRLEGLCVLCIDNEPMILQGMQAMLSGWGCEVLTALNAAQASSLLEAGSRPHIYLADYHLDEQKTGVQALKQLEVQLQGNLAGIVITADRTDTIAEEIRSAGYLLLHKPVRPAALRASMTRLVQSYKLDTTKNTDRADQ